MLFPKILKFNNLIVGSLLLIGCSPKQEPTPPVVIDKPIDPVVVKSDIKFWMTSGNKNVLFKEQTNAFVFGTTTNANPNIEVDTTETYQTMDGFGYTLTGGSALVINQLSMAKKQELLNELFGSAENSIGVSYLRLSLGASDLSEEVFSYHSKEDIDLKDFSLSKDLEHVVPVLKEILKINPKIKLMATPWSAPVWMKTNQNSKGGSLKPEFYAAYANYFVKYIEAMKAQGIPIDAITVQNEPENPNNNPSMTMTAPQQSEFIKKHLGPAFKAKSITTKIVIFDHNCDNPGYPTSILDDKEAKAFVDGSAFHLYAGNISALSSVRNAHPDRNIYFTEQFTSSKGDFGGDLGWHMQNVIVGATRNWAKVVLEWNLASNLNMGPSTPGGCTECLGALTVGTDYSRNVSYYIVAHLSKFVPAGSVRIKSGTANNLLNVAFRTPAGKKVLLVYNQNAAAQNFNIGFNGKNAPVILQGNSVGTFVW